MRRSLILVGSVCAACAASPEPPEAPATVPAASVAPAAPSVSIGASTLEVSFEGEAADELRDRSRAWIADAGRAVAGYYGALPFTRLRIAVRFVEGSGLSGGHAEMLDEPTVSIDVGRATGAGVFAQDWRMTHELVHFAFPNVQRRSHWIEEGIATYVEPIARVRAGTLPEHAVYEEWLDNMHLGQPEAGDRGLDHTPSWARTYWGGALFCLSADVRIRTVTGGRYGLEHALRGIVAAGGRMDASWPIARAFAVGDAAVETRVLSELYAQVKDSATAFDLDRSFEALGIRRAGRELELDPAPQKTALRRAIVLGQ